MNLTGFDYLADRPGAAGGLARVATRIRQHRAEAAQAGIPVLLFDNGDALQGGPMDEAALERGGPHPLMRVFGLLGYDAIGLGNHDFDFGLDTLLRVLEDAPCPVICTNLRWLDRPAPDRIRPWTILGAGEGARVGVLSFLPPQTMIWNASLLRGRVAVTDILAAARAAVPTLRAAGCDRVVALAHSGLGRLPHREGAENAAQALAALDGIDAVIAGHTHDLAAPSGGAPIVLPGWGGSALGVISCGPEGAVATLDPVDASVPPAPCVSRALSEDHAATRRFWSGPAGHATAPLHSYFSFIAPDRGMALVAAAQAAALRPHLAGTGAADLPMISAVAPSRFGARAGPGHYTDIPAGPLRRRHLADLHAFANSLSAVVVTGAQLRDWIEKSAAVFAQVAPGQRRAPLLEPGVPGHDFDVLHGVSYDIALDAPARFAPDGTACGGPGRLRSLRLDGVPVTPEQRVVVALSSYRANGGGAFPHLPDAPRVTLPDIRVRAAMEAYLTGCLPRDPLERAPRPWQFAPLPGASVVCPTGPGARAYLDELGQRLLDVRGPDSEGFLHLHVAL